MKKKKKKILSDKNIIKDLKKKLNDAATQVEEDKKILSWHRRML